VDRQDVVQPAHIENFLDLGAKRADGELDMADLGGARGFEHGTNAGTRDIVEA
jgi:hypothetical protein